MCHINTFVNVLTKIQFHVFVFGNNEILFKLFLHELPETYRIVNSANKSRSTEDYIAQYIDNNQPIQEKTMSVMPVKHSLHGSCNKISHFLLGNALNSMFNELLTKNNNP